MSNVKSITLFGLKVTIEHIDAEPSVQNFSQPEHAQEYAASKAEAHGLEVTVVGAAAEEGSEVASAQTERPVPNSRESLDAGIAALPGDYKDADYVVGAMRAHYGDVFTDADEARVRELVIAVK